MTGRPAIVGLGLALPRFPVPRDAVLAALVRRLGADTDAAGFARRVFRRSGVRSRFSCLPDFGAGEPTLFGADTPGTAARMEAYRQNAAPLAATACRRALRNAQVCADEISHLVVVTCTGFYAPGPDVDLVRLLGLRADVERTLVGFMGCYAAFNGLRVARHSVEASPAAKVLVVCVELCSLHFRADPARDNVVAHALFGDGAAAVVVARSDFDHALALLDDARTRLEPDTTAHMGWRIGDHGFELSLSSYVPRLLAADIGSFVRSVRDPAGIASWCVHPGGSAILDRIEEALVLPGDALDASRRVLENVGNVSSGTVLFVLDEELRRVPPGAAGVLLGFGPGLTMEGVGFTRGAAAALPARSAMAGRMDAWSP